MPSFSSIQSTVLKTIDAFYESSPQLGFHRLEVSIPRLLLLEWLAIQPFDHKWYWSNRDQTEEYATLGMCDCFPAVMIQDSTWFPTLMRRLEAIPNARYWGGFSFDDTQHDSLWTPFGSGIMFLPLIEIVQTQDTTTLALHIRLDSIPLPAVRATLAHAVEALDFTGTMLERIHHQCVDRHDDPSENLWTQSVDQLLNKLDSDSLKKVVLSRKTTFTFSHLVDPFIFLDTIRNYAPDAFFFLYQPHPGRAFIGGTPERLYLRQHSTLFSESLAGTIARGKDEAEDNRLEKELLASEKCKFEHNCVSDFLNDSFSSMCSTFTRSSERMVKKLPIIQHLLVEFKGELRPNITDHDILRTLHPTPAVAGVPTQRALDMIQSLESVARGWYAGPIGYIGLSQSEFNVAIRSGVVEDHCISLFAGAGLVQGSDAQEEWNEIESKIGLFKQLFVDKDPLTI